MNYDKTTLLQGNKMKQKAEEQPTTFAEYNGSAEAIPDESGLQANNETRMAGQKGLFALQLMNDPQLAANTTEWMSLYGQSVPGMQFNQAKMAMGLMPGPIAPPAE